MVHLLLLVDSTDEALASIAALLGTDEVDVMIRLARFDLLAMTRPATNRRVRVIDDLAD